MTDTAPAPEGQTTAAYGHAEDGKVAAVIVYLLYLAGVFSAHLISPIGVIVAYVTRSGASPWVRSHLDQQIRMFWSVFWWVLLPLLIGIAAFVLDVGVGLILAIPVLLIWGLVAIVTTIWFGVKSFIGLMQMLNGKPA